MEFKNVRFCPLNSLFKFFMVSEFEIQTASFLVQTRKFRVLNSRVSGSDSNDFRPLQSLKFQTAKSYSMLDVKIAAQKIF